MEHIAINGRDCALPGPITVDQLLERSGLAGKRVAVERNGAVVPKSRHHPEWIRQGDRIEIIVAVGGG